MSYNLTTVTNAGNKLFNTIIDDNTRLVLDRIEVSATQLDSSTDLKSMTAIDSVVQTLPVNGVSKGDTSIVVKTVLDNKDIKTDYKAWVFGIWGHDEVANVDTLVGVITTTATPDTVPAFDPGSTIGLKYSFGIVYSNTAEITIKQVNDQYAINDDVVHISGDESVTGTKTFQTIKIDNDSTKDVVTTDGYNISLDNGKTKFVPADDATVVHATEMRKPASEVASIEEVKAKQDIIGYKPADDKEVVHTVDTSDWQQQALFNRGDYRAGTTGKTEYGAYVKANFSKPGIYYVRDDNAEISADGVSLGFIDTTLITEGNGWWYAFGIGSTNGSFVSRKINLESDSGWIRYVNIAEWENANPMNKYGEFKFNLYSSNNDDLIAKAKTLKTGQHWFYCQGGTKNNPAGNSPLRGTVYVTNPSNEDGSGGYWYIAGTDPNNVQYHIYCDGGNIRVDAPTEAMSALQHRVTGGYGQLITCPSGTDFGSFVRGNSVPVGFSMIRDGNTHGNVAVYKENIRYGWAWYQGTDDVVFHQAYWSNGVWSGWKTRNEYIRASNESDAVAKSKADPNNLYYWV